MEEFDLQGHLNALEVEDNYLISNELDVESSSPEEIAGALNDAIDSISETSENVLKPDVFDTLRSLLKHAEHLSGQSMSRLLDAIQSGFTAEIDATAACGNPDDYRSHRHFLEAYAFLLRWFVMEAESSQKREEPVGPSKKGRGKASRPAGKSVKDNWTWADSIPDTFQLMSKALRLKTERIWQTTQERDAFVGCFVRPAHQITESEAYMKVTGIRLGYYKVICIAVKNHGQNFSVQTSIMQNLQYFEHLSEPMAEMLSILDSQYDHSQLGDDILKDIAAKQFNAQDSKGPRSFSRFLVKFAEVSPRLVLKQIIVLQKHLDSESYPMRNAVIEVIGLLIKVLSMAEDGNEHSKHLDAFFDLLFDRFLDLNSYVRSKVTTVFLKICDYPAKFPKIRLELLQNVIRSLNDKSSQVRKNCIALLTKLILTHPYGRMHGGELALKEWKSRYDAVVKEIEPLDLPPPEELQADEGDEGAEGADAELKDEETEEGQELQAGGEGGEDEDLESDSDDDEEVAAAKKAKREQKLAAAKAKPKTARKPRRSEGIDLAAVTQEQALAQLDQDKLMKLRLTKKYYSDALTFITQIERGVPTIAELLASTVKSEVLEAMEFFRVAHEYKIEASEYGVRRMLHLIWSKDNSTVEDGKEIKSVRSRLIECYKMLYFEPLADYTPQENINRIARNMIELTYDATLAELTSLEQLMSVMMADGAVHQDVINKLWNVYSAEQNIKPSQRRGAIIVLGMLAAPKPEVVSERVDLLLKIGLGPHSLGKSDLVLAKYTCIALRRVGGSIKKVKGSLTNDSVRLPMDNPVFECLQQTIKNPVESMEWFPLAEQVIDTIYVLGEQPEGLCASILKNLASRVFGVQSAAQQSADEDVDRGADQDGTDEETNLPSETASQRRLSQGATQQNSNEPQAKVFHLSQLLFTAGHCSIKHLVHLELVEREMKRQKAENDKRNAPDRNERSEELEQVAGNIEDDIGDVIVHTKEKELLYGPKSLLAIFGPMSVAICSQPKSYPNRILQSAAVLAMSKFMCVSAKFCEDHLMLLFKILETSKDATIRSNIVIALGDIAVCFSTIMDENSDRVYAGLTDKDLNVKKNTLMVLTFLILNGMIKVKGQLGEMAKCLEDEEARISDLAKLFFSELSTKDNAIYNNLPDVISHLSIGKHAVDEETFQRTMKFIFTFIDKEKQAESVVDKLCQRFRLVTEERQWRDIAYCLSLLPFKSERSVKKLVEGLPFYQDKLHEKTVFARFADILQRAKANKAAKNEGDLTEFENALEQHRAKGEEDHALQKKVERKRKKAPARKAKRVQESPPSSPE